ncbi:hypothetical protein [Endothiovibrio diazotrophicus]
MKTTHVQLKKTLTLAAAGKMTLAAGNASAALGKADTTPTDQALPTVTLEEIGYPLDLVTPPTSGINAGEADAALGKASGGTGGTSNYTGSANGFIWAGEMAQSVESNGGDGSKSGGDTTSASPAQNRIDFIVTGIRNDIPMQIFLAYSPAQNPSGWAPTAVGQLQLDINGLAVLAGVSTQPVATFADFGETPFGFVPQRDSREVTIPVVLKDLNDTTNNYAGRDIYFQAIAIPVSETGDFQWDQAQVSEIDHFVIERYESSTDSGSKNSDASASASKTGGDSGTNTTDTGGK